MDQVDIVDLVFLLPLERLKAIFFDAVDFSDAVKAFSKTAFSGEIGGGAMRAISIIIFLCLDLRFSIIS